MTEWTASVGIGQTNPDQFPIDKFTDWGGVLGSEPHGGYNLVLAFPAANLRQAAATAVSIVEAAGLHPTSVEVYAEADFERKSVFAAPDTVGVPEAAKILGVTAQAIRHRIASGSLPARRAGRDWRIPRVAIEV